MSYIFKTFVIKAGLLLSIILAISSCSSKNTHDGTYISSIRMMGLSTAWVIEGQSLKVFTNMGSLEIESCEQSPNSIKIIRTGSVYETDSEGNFILGYSEILGETKMNRISDRIDYSSKDLLEILSTSYEHKE